MKVNEIFNKKRIIAFVMAFAMVVTSLSGISFASNAEGLDDTTPVFQLYSSVTSDHFFTISEADKEVAVKEYGYTYEKEAFNVPVKSDEPVYCMVCPSTAEHIYSTDLVKLTTWCEDHPGYYMQGDGATVWYSADESTGKAVYQFFNPNQVDGKASHMYVLEGTKDYSDLVSWGWQNDGVMFYAAEEAPTEFEIVATQSGTSEVTVVSTMPLTLLDEITLYRAGKVQEATVSISDDGYTATLTTASPIGDATYTVVVDPLDPELDSADDTFEGEVGELSALVFLSDKLVLLDPTAVTGAVPIIGVNQFGEQVKLSTLTCYCSNGDALYSSSQNMIYCSANGALPGGFKVGDNVTVTAIYQNGSLVKQASANLEVANASYVSEIEFGELATTKAALKDKHVTHNNLKTDTYYFPVLTAEDQYGNKLTKDMLNLMLKGGTVGTQNVTKTLYITPDAATGVFAYVDEFDELEDGTIILKIKDGALSPTPGTQYFNLVSVGGTQETLEVAVEDNPYIDTLSLEIPELYSGVQAEIGFTAVDQYGDIISMEDLYAFGPTTDDNANGTYVMFGDTNNLTQSTSWLNTKAGAFEVEKSPATKSFKIKYTPQDNLTKDTTQILSVNTAKPTMYTENLTVHAKGTPAGIKGLASTVDTVIGDQNKTVSLGDKKNIVFTDSYGSVIKADENPQFGDADLTTEDFYYTVDDSKAKYTTMEANGDVTETAGEGEGQDTYTIKLMQKGTTNDVEVAKKDVKITVSSKTYKKFEAEIDASQQLIYIGAENGAGYKTIDMEKDQANTSTTFMTETPDYAKVKLYGIDTSGNRVQIPYTDYQVTSTIGLTFTAETGRKADKRACHQRNGKNHD